MIAGSSMIFWINFFIYAFLVVLIVACPLMCIVILMQRSKQEGLGAAFGGGFTESVWGAQTSNVLVKATVVLAATFFVVSIALARLYTVRTHLMETEKPSTLQQQLLNPTVPTNASGTPVVPTATPITSTAPAASKTTAATMSAPASTATNAAPAKTPATK
jgi:preprotein translocase subunit SecG